MIFKQLLQVKALQFLQIDSCRLGSVNENLSVLLMAKKFESKGTAACRSNLHFSARQTSVVPSVICRFDFFLTLFGLIRESFDDFPPGISSHECIT